MLSSMAAHPLSFFAHSGQRHLPPSRLRWCFASLWHRTCWSATPGSACHPLIPSAVWYVFIHLSAGLHALQHVTLTLTHGSETYRHWQPSLSTSQITCSPPLSNIFNFTRQLRFVSQLWLLQPTVPSSQASEPLELNVTLRGECIKAHRDLQVTLRTGNVVVAPSRTIQHCRRDIAVQRLLITHPADRRADPLYKLTSLNLTFVSPGRLEFIVTFNEDISMASLFLPSIAILLSGFDTHDSASSFHLSPL